jgi:hypothetical protein
MAMRKILLSILIATSGVSIGYSEGLVDGNWTYTLNENNEATIQSNRSASGHVVIPATVGGYPVKTVGGGLPPWPSLFPAGNNAVISVTIPDGVKSIGNTAFIHCVGLTSVTIPDSVTSIGDLAFNECYNLTNLTLSDNLTSIGEAAFRECYSLTSMTIPDSVTSIGRFAFNSCVGLTNLSVNSNVLLSIEEEAFQGCPIVGPVRVSVLSTIAPSAFPAGVDLVRDVEPLVKAVAQGIVASLPNNYGIATKADLGDAISSATTQAIAQVQSDPNTFNLFSAAQHQANFDAGRADGVNAVIASPNNWSLYTADQIKNMAMGDLVLTKNVEGKWVLNYDIEQSADLVTWSPYAIKAEELTGLPTNKAFIRIRLKEQ